jgi:hypothetical protein
LIEGKPKKHNLFVAFSEKTTLITISNGIVNQLTYKVMKRLFLFISVSTACLVAFSGCKKDEDPENNLLISSDFVDSKDGWQAGFAEYDGDSEGIYELEEELAMLPEPLDQSKRAYKVSGMNRSDDLFMYLKRKVTGLEPNTRYKASFDVQLASSARSGGIGAGGAPGEGVGIGIGVTSIEPVATANDDNFYEMNIDKINQCCTDGEDMKVIGNVANGTDEYVYKLIDRNGEFAGQTDAEGNLWLIIGTDSGFEGLTTLYYNNIEVKLEKQ